MSETRAAEPNSNMASHAEPRRARTRAAITNTAAYVSHFSPSASEALASNDSEKRRSSVSRSGARQPSHTRAVTGESRLTQPAGRGTACTNENSANAPSTRAGAGSRRNESAASVPPASASAEMSNNDTGCTVPIARAEPTTTMTKSVSHARSIESNWRLLRVRCRRRGEWPCCLGREDPSRVQRAAYLAARVAEEK